MHQTKLWEKLSTCWVKVCKTHSCKVPKCNQASRATRISSGHVHWAVALEVALALLVSNLLKNEERRTFEGLIKIIGTMAQSSPRKKWNEYGINNQKSQAWQQRLQGLSQLPGTGSFLKWRQVQKKWFLKLKKSTPTDYSTDETTTIGPQIQTFNSLVDYRSLILRLTVFDKFVEAVCDSGTSVLFEL